MTGFKTPVFFTSLYFLTYLLNCFRLSYQIAKWFFSSTESLEYIFGLIKISPRVKTCTYFFIFINDQPDDNSFQLCNYTYSTSIYSCLDSKADRFDNVKLAVIFFINDLQSAANWGRKWLVNCLQHETYPPEKAISVFYQHGWC